MKIRLFVLLLSVSCLQSAGGYAEISIQSPDRAVEASISVDESGRLGYEIVRAGAPVVERSPLGVTVDGVDLGLGVSLGGPDWSYIDVMYPTRGMRSVAVDRHTGAKIPVKHAESGAEYVLEFRVFNDGAAYRYVIPGTGKRKLTGEASAWRLPEGCEIWYQTNLNNYEGEFQKAKVEKADPGDRLGLPVTVELPGGGFAALTEGALFNYSGMSLKAAGDNTFAAEFVDDLGGWTLEGEISTPWRITIAVGDLNALVNSDIIANVNEPPAPELADADWIRPGRSLWSWLNSGRAGVTFENSKRYVDYAAEIGYEYILVDEGWEEDPAPWKNRKGWEAPGKTSMDLMAELVEYAAGRGVGVIVWKSHYLLSDPKYRAKFFKKLNEIGVVGVKIDFMDSESKTMIDFYEACMREGAENRLMIDFHGANKPTGESRTWPNEVTREGVRGLEYKMIFAKHNATLPFTRYLAGHADYTPMYFQKDHMGNTSFAHQLAAGAVLGSPVTFFGDDPENYLNSPARDAIEAMPVVWDETIVLEPSRIGRLAAFARRSGGDWFVAILNAGGRRQMEIPLDFLGEGKYKVVAYGDVQADPMEMRRKEVTLDSAGRLPVKMRAGGGYLAMLKKIN